MNGNDFMGKEQLATMSDIGKQLEISNQIAILDRLYAADSITEESYIEELKELLSKSKTKREG